MSKPSWMDGYIKELQTNQKAIEFTADDDHMTLIHLLSKRLVLGGKIAATLSGEYKRTYAARKQMHAEAYLKAAKNKAAVAEMAIVEVRKKPMKT
ncbi:hypothetical protein RYX56_19885 [Alkalihalophilus lindianensis]|uniref:Uncharacterized protein n=1 Tax=Alkalihalophilus lindianensis TaxID=1630542 RepID=A0ABU3XFL6_9BACI|nr:hypothetical protein [Alkalihalophilus lindianensis]MDV2686623.1 hypothetical protein [Alkalihalophilus lindianensis]